MANYEEQLERIRRWFSRIYPLMNGSQTPFVREAECFADDFHAFFVECHSMKDWLKNDLEFDRQTAVESFVSRTPSLQFCADLANRKKHLFLRDRRHEKGNVDGLMFSFAVFNSEETNCDTGRDQVGATRANEIKAKWIECGVDPAQITIAVFCDVIVNNAPSGDPFDGGVDLAWDAFEAWCNFIGGKYSISKS